MGDEGKSSKVREAQVLKGTQQEPEKELTRLGLVRCFMVQGHCTVCYAEGELQCATCNDVYCSNECYEEDWEMHRESCQHPSPRRGKRGN